MIGGSRKRTANVSWLLKFGVRVFLKSTVRKGTVSEVTSHGLQWENKAYKLKRSIAITVSV